MNSINVTISNFSGDLIANWGVSPIFTCIICVMAVVTNGSALCMLVRKKNLRTSFGVHLIFLLSYNLIYSLIQNPLDMVNNLYPYWTLSAQWCTLYLYTTYVVAALEIHSHLLLTLNRVWATTTGSKMLTQKSAVLSCLCTFAYVHMVLLPGCIQDALYYRPTVEASCFLNSDAQQGWSITVQFLVFFLPEAVILGGYPFIWYKRRARQKMHSLKFGRTSATGTAGKSTGNR